MPIQTANHRSHHQGWARLVLALSMAACLVQAGPAPARTFGSDYTPIEAPEFGSCLSGDFTGDGRDDLLGQDYREALWLLVARRAGGFEEPRQLEQDSDFQPMTVADLDGDGLADLVGIVRTNRWAAVRRARVGGSFEPFEYLPGHRRSHSITVGDFNADGRVEVAAADLDSARFLIHQLRDDDTWEMPISLPVTPYAAVVRAGDYDGDGQADLMVQFSSSSFLGFRGGVSFALAPPDTHSVGPGIDLYLDVANSALRDMEGDSRPELVFRGRQGKLYVCHQESPGRWVATNQTTLPLRSSYLAVADINGDDRPDVAVLTESGSYLWAFDNDGDGGFLDPRPIMLPGPGRQLIVGSWISGGEEIAVVTGNRFLGIVGFDPDVQPVSKTLIPLGNREEGIVVPADLNGDGHLDLVIGILESSETGTIRVAMGDGHRHFEVVERPIGFPPQSLAVADVTGDGFPDLVAASNQRSAIWIFAGDGTGDLELGRQIYSGQLGDNLFNKSIMAADLDEDGDIDLALPGQAGELLVFTNPGRGLFGPPIVASVRGHVTGLSHVDADDQPGPEIYVLSSEPGLIQSFHLSRDGRLLPLRVQDSISRSDRQTLADLNGDCVADFLLQVGSGDRVTVQYGQGQGVFGPPVFERLGRELSWATAFDTDQDGRDDLVAYSGYSGTLLIRRGVPGGLGDSEEFSVGGNLNEYALADFDADGRIDLIATSYSSSDVVILWNEGDVVDLPDDQAASQLRLERVSPNPGRGQVQLDLVGLTPGEPMTLQIFDVSGRLVSSLGPITPSSNRHCWRWNGRGQDASLVSSGVYTLRIRTEQEQVTTRVTILR